MLVDAGALIVNFNVLSKYTYADSLVHCFAVYYTVEMEFALFLYSRLHQLQIRYVSKFAYLQMKLLRVDAYRNIL